MSRRVRVSAADVSARHRRARRRRADRRHPRRGVPAASLAGGVVSDALDLLEVLWGSTPAAWSTLHALNGDDAMTTDVVSTDDPVEWKAWLAAHEDEHAWYRACPMAERPTGAATRQQIRAVAAFFADIDWRSAKHPKAPERADVQARGRAGSRASFVAAPASSRETACSSTSCSTSRPSRRPCGRSLHVGTACSSRSDCTTIARTSPR